MKKLATEEILKRQVVEIDAVDKYGNTALHYVCYNPLHNLPFRILILVSVAAALVRGGTKVDKEDDDDRTVLHLAAMKGYEEVTAEILKRQAGVEIHAVDKSGNTALQIQRMIKIVQYYT